jgi:hypothetical protein
MPERGLSSGEVLDFNAAFLLLVTVTFVAMFFQQWRGVAREVVAGLDNIRGKQDQGKGNGSRLAA